AEIAEIAIAVQDSLNKIHAVKSSTAKINNCKKALARLRQAEEYPECREVITNYDELKDRLISIPKVLPVVDAVEKAYRFRFKGKDSSELNALKDALYEIMQKNVTNHDFVQAMVFPEATGEILTIEGIRDRCKELGWEPSQTHLTKP